MDEEGSIRENHLWNTKKGSRDARTTSKKIDLSNPEGKWIGMADDKDPQGISQEESAEDTSNSRPNIQDGAFERAVREAGANSIAEESLPEQFDSHVLNVDDKKADPPKNITKNIDTKNQVQDVILNKSLSNEDLLHMYRRMVLCRTLDERIWMLNRQGKAAIMASSQGHEASQIGSVAALRKKYDLFYIYYRDLAVLLDLGLTPTQIIKGFLAKQGEPLSGARQFPTHGAHPKYGIVNLSNVVATHMPQAVGAALAAKMNKEDRVVIVYFGDGASSAGDTHEAMNFASIHKLPVIFFCENNKYAISVPLRKQMAVESVASRAEGYGMPGFEVDGCDIVAVYEVTAESAKRARSGEGPTLIEAQVERYLPHTSDDDDSIYRSAQEIEEAKKRDPLRLLRTSLQDIGQLSDNEDEIIQDEARRLVNEATEEAEAAPYPETRDFYQHVVSDSGLEPGEYR